MNSKTFLILGIPSGGLFLARQLKRAYPGSIVLAIGSPTADIGRYSNKIDRFWGITQGTNLLEKVQGIIAEYGAITCAYFGSNPMLERVVFDYPCLFELMPFENPLTVYQELVDKSHVDVLCEDLKVRRPSAYNLSGVAKSSIPFPIVIKPLEKLTTLGVEKCAYVANVDELQSYLDKLHQLGIPLSKMCAQQCIKGNNRWEYGYGGFFCHGKPVVDICFYQLRQSPQGLCCYTKEVVDERLKSMVSDLVRPILEYTQYNGFVEFDIKQDEDSGLMYLLDVNPRPWKSVDMLNGKLGKSSVFTPSVSDNTVIWRYPYKELSSRKNDMNVPYEECRKLACGNKNKMIFSLLDWDDLKPILMQCYYDTKSVLKRLVKRISCK